MTERKIILTRHLATEYNLNGINMGRVHDAGIISSEEEKRQFKRKVGVVIQKYEASRDNSLIVSSPLKRCLETSSLIKEEMGFEVNTLIMENLIETDMGGFSGKGAKELREVFGNQVDEWMHRPESFRFPDGESYREVRLRVQKALDSIKRHFRLKNLRFVFVCTHVDVAKMMISEVLGMSFNGRRNFVVPNGSISILGVSDDGKIRVEGLNVLPF